MQEDLLQQTSLKRYFVHMVVATLAVAGLPLALAYVATTGERHLPFYLLILLPATLSLLLGALGAALWERHPGSKDLVFDDLMAWGYLRRLRNQRKVVSNVRRLQLHRNGRSSLSREQQTRILTSLSASLEAGDPYTQGHSSRVARHCYMVAARLKLAKSERERIRLAAALHDIGKLEIPRQVLHKPGRLDDAEYELIKKHAALGANLVAQVGDPELTAMIRHHHERLDGTGYPGGIAGEAIPLGARIIAVADTFDAITSRRPYRSPRKHKDALDILRKEAGTQLDAGVVRAFVSYYRGTRSIGWWLTLSSAVRSLQQFSIGALGRSVANAAVVGSAAALATAGGGLVALTEATTAARDTVAQHRTTVRPSERPLAETESRKTVRSREGAVAKSRAGERPKSRSRDRAPSEPVAPPVGGQPRHEEVTPTPSAPAPAIVPSSPCEALKGQPAGHAYGRDCLKPSCRHDPRCHLLPKRQGVAPSPIERARRAVNEDRAIRNAKTSTTARGKLGGIGGPGKQL